MTAVETQRPQLCSSLLPRSPSLEGSDPEGKRAEIAEYFTSVFDRYESLFDLLANDAAFYDKPIALRHPLIFYFGHTATFFTNKLVLAKLLPERIDPRLESTCAVGVDEMSWDDLDDTHYEWPSVGEVRAYRQKVRAAVLKIINTLPLQLPIQWNGDWWPIMMCVEHELIHLETSTVLIRQHKLDYVQSLPQWAPCREHGPAPENQLLPVPAGQVSLGKPRDADKYGWDNEYGDRQVELETFQVSRFLVSNAEYLQFVEAGGYTDASLWDEEGTRWRDFTRAEHPTFWIWRDAWYLRLMTEEVPMPWDWPVEVNCLEASAFCRWKARETGKPIRLPTEDEWYRLYDHAGVEEVSQERASANLQLEHYASSCPVTQFPHGDFFDVVGNVWQWTHTPIYPFDGFQVHPDRKSVV